MRLALLLTATIACSTNGKREDVAPMPSGSQTKEPAPYTGPRVIVSTPNGDVQVKVEVVSTPRQIQKGLMFRKHLPPDAGMLFLMGEYREHPFWMRNTLIPLDMIFIDRDKTVAGVVENAEPLTETLRTIGKPSLFVLEVNGGWAKANGVGSGTKIRFENVSE